MRYQCPFCGSTNRKHDEIACEEAAWRNQRAPQHDEGLSETSADTDWDAEQPEHQQD